MVMFSSNDRCCFSRLGIARGSSEREIKQAYRRLARASHPDMFTDPAEKERATAAFRELYDTYQEALVANIGGSDSGNQYHSAAREPNRNARTTTDSAIRKAFQDICDELDRAREDSRREHESFLIRSVQEAWPDRDLTWTIVKDCLSWTLDGLVEYFEGGLNDDISSFLREKAAQRQLERRNELESQLDQLASYIEDHWPDADDAGTDADAETTRLKEWAQTELMILDYTDVADRVRGKNPLAATSIMDWKAEHIRNIKKRIAEELQQSAKDIIQVYPDREAIATIVERHLLWERQDLYNLLPETMRLALQGPHRAGELEGLHLELEEPDLMDMMDIEVEEPDPMVMG
jgi:hypothetical protein